jgi:hypothetical protein
VTRARPKSTCERYNKGETFVVSRKSQGKRNLTFSPGHTPIDEVVALMEIQSGRVEKRLPINLPIWLTSFEHPGPFEKAVTENVSPAGARIIAAARWEPNQTVVVLCSPGCIANALVVYSQPLTSETHQFAVGVRLQTTPQGWPVKPNP